MTKHSPQTIKALMNDMRLNSASSLREQIDALEQGVIDLEAKLAAHDQVVADLEAQRVVLEGTNAEVTEALRLSKDEVNRQRTLLAIERRTVVERDAEIEQLKAQLNEPTDPTPEPTPKRYPLRADFDRTKLPAKTSAAYAHVLTWDKTTDFKKQPDMREIVDSDFVHLKMFREWQMGLNIYRVKALLGDLPAMLELADLTRRLIAKALTGYGPIPTGYTLGANVNVGNEMVGVRRYNIGIHDGGWKGNSGSDENELERCLTYGTLAANLELLEGCAHAHADILAAASALRELLCVDMAVRVKGIARAKNADGDLKRTLQTFHHPTTAFAYACRVIGARLAVDPNLLSRAQALAAKHNLTISAEEFARTYSALVPLIRADYDRVTGPDGRVHLVFPHGVQALRPLTSKLEMFHYTVYLPETAMTLFADWLSGGTMAARDDLVQLGNTVANCIHIDGFTSNLLSDDMGGGGLRDPVEEQKGGAAFREVRFRGGGKAMSRWHLTDRNTGYGDSQTHIGTTGRGMAHTMMAFTDFPERLTWLDQADRALGQEWRVGIDVARLLCAAVDEGLVKL